MAVKEPNIIPIELDDVEVEIIASFGLLFDCVTKRRTQILSQYRDRRGERRAAVESRKETLQQLSESKLDLQGKMKNNELHSMVEKIMDDIDAKMKLLELEDANANNEKMLFKYDVKDLEEKISQFGKLNDNSSQQKSTQIITCALYDFKATVDGQLRFRSGDLIEIVEGVSEGWCMARNLKTGQKGLTPNKYVAPFEGMEKFSNISMDANLVIEGAAVNISSKEENTLGKDNQPQTRSLKRKFAVIVKYDYSALTQEDLPFSKGEKLWILDDESANWWKAENVKGEQGYIPSNYAQIIDSSTKSQQQDGKYLILGLPPKMDNWKIEGSNLEVKEEMSKGSFGIIFKGILKKKGASDQTVTVKKCISGLIADQKQLLREADKLKSLRHPNIVEFIGVSMHDGCVCIILELMPEGDFLTFLRKKALNEKKHILSEIVLGVSKGMSYLTSKDCVHRNLAARNCVIGAKRSVKIGSFRMSQFQDELDKDLKLARSETFPIKWTAPEVLNKRRITCQSDVWSYGILLWETFSYGSHPYPDMNNKTAVEKVHTGYRLLAPDGTPPDIYNLMKNCWEYQPQDRPRFPKIVQSLESITQKLKKENI